MCGPRLQDFVHVIQRPAPAPAPALTALVFFLFIAKLRRLRAKQEASGARGVECQPRVKGVPGDTLIQVRGDSRLSVHSSDGDPNVRCFVTGG